MNSSELANREIFRFSGPPENWITGIKYMTWGLEEKYLDYWHKIEPGDIFLMHSMATNTFVKSAPSSVIGFGVVGSNFTKKKGPLWIQEIEKSENIWPLLVPFSEVYLFSNIRPSERLEAPDARNYELIINEAHELLKDGIPLPAEFPKMGSFSKVNPETVVKVFNSAHKFYLYNSAGVTQETYLKSTEFKKAKSVDEITNRKAASLEQLNIIKQKSIRQGQTTFTKDMQSLERAETAHHETLGMLLDMLRDFGYETYYNRHVDLFAVKDGESYLFEVKSLSKKNFRPQARKGIVQLFEYDYFEVRKFIEEKGLKSRPSKALIFSEGPKDMNYVKFINNLNISAGFFSERKMIASGNPFRIS